MAAAKYRLRRIHGEGRAGLGKDGIIHFGSNGGYQLINLVYQFGAKKIVLLGYDMQMTGGKSHHHGDHPAQLNRSLPFNVWKTKFIQLAQDLKNEGVEVINATRETALNCFPKVKLEDAL